jgi:hypothetical protein
MTFLFPVFAIFPGVFKHVAQYGPVAALPGVQDKRKGKKS